MTDGFCSVELEGVPPGKSHDQLVVLLVEPSVKFTVNGSQPLVPLVVKAACGAEEVVTICIDVSLPQSFVAVS